ncbi:MAG: type II and III secretion system protein [Betaproteobacteria bacterium]|nr:MAG: type II and III secretion system protein [Betaproteobacteria bacterium]
MRSGTTAAVVLLAGLLTACAQAPIKPAETHLRAGEPQPEGSIPPPVQLAPVLPPPKPSVRPETYSVVVNNVRVQELLFALARDARLNVDINPDITGSVTLNAIDQTLPQLLARIARQVDLRWEIDGQTLVVMRDTPFLRAYKIDYLSASRNVTMKSTASTLFGGATSGPTSTGATATIDVKAENNLWDSIVLNVKEILRETDKIVPGAATSAVPLQPPPVAPGAGQSAPAAGPAAPQPPSPAYQEAASVIANRESGVLYVRATSKQHERVQEFLDQVMAGAKRQVLVEATVAEVQLRNEYQRGIEWQRLRSGPGGLELTQPATPPPTGFNLNPFVIGYVSTGNNFSVTLKLLEQFGDVRVLSSPKLSVMNNQTAILRVTRDIIYFTITPSTSGTASTLGVVVTQPAFTTTPNVAAEGFMMAVLPQINDTDGVVLNVRPTIRRQVATARDPNPALQGLATQNDIPLFETREFDSILRLQSGQTAGLAGLMQDQVENTVTGIPGIRSIPIIGEALSSRSDLTRKTELVIFLRATVIRDPSIDGDFRKFRDQLPGSDFFAKPNPGSVAAPVGPAGAALQ